MKPRTVNSSSEERKKRRCRRTHAWVCRPFSQPSLLLLIYCNSYFLFSRTTVITIIKSKERVTKKNWGEKENRTQFLQLFCLQKDPIFFHFLGANRLHLMERTVCQEPHLRFIKFCRSTKRKLKNFTTQCSASDVICIHFLGTLH